MRILKVTGLLSEGEEGKREPGQQLATLTGQQVPNCPRADDGIDTNTHKRKRGVWMCRPCTGACTCKRTLVCIYKRYECSCTNVHGTKVWVYKGIRLHLQTYMCCNFQYHMILGLHVSFSKKSLTLLASPRQVHNDLHCIRKITLSKATQLHRNSLSVHVSTRLSRPPFLDLLIYPDSFIIFFLLLVIVRTI